MRVGKRVAEGVWGPHWRVGVCQGLRLGGRAKFPIMVLKDRRSVVRLQMYFSEGTGR